MQQTARPFIWLVALLLVVWPGSVLGHGGGTPRLTDVAVGPYRLFVWSQPELPRVGEMHFTMAVVQGNNGATANDSAAALDTPVLDAAVQLTLRTGTNPDQTIVRAVTRDQALFPQYYETDLEVSAAGIWHANVSVTGPDGAGDASFDVAVLPPQQINWLMLAGGILVLLLLILAGRPKRRTKVTT